MAAKKTKESKKAHPEKNIEKEKDNFFSSKLMLALVALVIVATIGFVYFGGSRNQPQYAPPVFQEPNPLPTQNDAAPTAQPPSNVIYVETPTGVNPTAWRPNQLRCYASSDCYVLNGYCRTRLLTNDPGMPISQGQNCACISQSCQIIG
jgi:hypothetical protein